MAAKTIEIVQTDGVKPTRYQAVRGGFHPQRPNAFSDVSQDGIQPLILSPAEMAGARMAPHFKGSSRLHRKGRVHVSPQLRCLGMDIPDMGWLAHDEQVAHLAEQASFRAGTADMLGEIGAVHRATDPPLGQEARRSAAA